MIYDRKPDHIIQLKIMLNIEAFLVTKKGKNAVSND